MDNLIEDEFWTQACLDTYETRMLVGPKYRPTDEDVARRAAKLREANASDKREGLK